MSVLCKHTVDAGTGLLDLARRDEDIHHAATTAGIFDDSGALLHELSLEGMTAAKLLDARKARTLVGILDANRLVGTALLRKALQVLPYASAVAIREADELFFGKVLLEPSSPEP